MNTIRLQRSNKPPYYIWMPNTLPTSIINILDKLTSYEMKGYEHTTSWQTGKWDGVVRLLKQSRNGTWYFSEGLLPQIRQTLKAFGYSIELQSRIKPNKTLRDVHWRGPELRDYQKTTINSAIAEFSKGEGCILNLPTASGKTLMGMKIIHELGVPTLITIHNKELMKQWKTEIETNLGYIANLYGGGKKKNWESANCSEITIATVQTLVKDTKLNLNHFDLLLADEVHHYSADTWYELAKRFNMYYKCGMSATVDREDGSKLKFISSIGKILTTIDAKQLINEGYLTRPELIILRPPAPLKLGYTYQQEYNNGIILNEGRNQLIAETARKYVNEGKQVYVNVTRINHGKRLAQLIGCEFIDAKAKNRESEIENFTTGRSRAICSTLLGEGSNIIGMNVIVMASAGKSATATIQRAGRVLRLKEGKTKCTIVDFADSGKRLRQHFEKRRVTYREVLGI